MSKKTEHRTAAGFASPPCFMHELDPDFREFTDDRSGAAGRSFARGPDAEVPERESAGTKTAPVDTQAGTTKRPSP